MCWQPRSRQPDRPVALQGVIPIEDILQATFVEVWKNITTFERDDDEALFGWMATIANNKLIDRIRSERAVKRGGGRAVAGGVASTEPGRPSPDSLLTPVIYRYNIN